MANPSITIPLDPQTARAYDSAAPEEKRKIQALLSLWLRELAAVALRLRHERLSQCAAPARLKTSPCT